jgi:hypothetical protein
VATGKKRDQNLPRIEIETVVENDRGYNWVVKVLFSTVPGVVRVINLPSGPTHFGGWLLKLLG